MRVLLFILLAVITACGNEQNIQASTTGYILRNGDALEITIYGVVRARRKVVIDSRGYITFLLTGSVRAAGKTIPVLRKELNEIVISGAADTKSKNYSNNATGRAYGFEFLLF